MSPLHWAADRGHVNIVKCLVDKGAEVNSKDDELGVSEWGCTSNCGLVWVWVNLFPSAWLVYIRYNWSMRITTDCPYYTVLLQSLISLPGSHASKHHYTITIVQLLWFVILYSTTFQNLYEEIVYWQFYSKITGHLWWTMFTVHLFLSSGIHYMKLVIHVILQSSTNMTRCLMCTRHTIQAWSITEQDRSQGSQNTHGQ